LDTIRIEVITEHEPFINFSGRLHAPLPKIDEIVPLADFEASIFSLENPGSFQRHATVRLSVEYPISEFADFQADSEEEGEEKPDLFDWIEYCAADAFSVIREDLHDDEYLPSVLTVRGA
jgi:hypothetical protein